ncbi:MAG TPA: CapA family protein [Polyangiaceae bacterium]|nr:CapA family protein [Polyangiaceae bacterium]
MRIAGLALLIVAGCTGGDDTPPAPPAESAASPASAAPTSSAAPIKQRRQVTLLAGGDVSFGRSYGQMLLRDPTLNHLAPLTPLFETADIRFINLECPVSDQQGETESPINRLVFTAPPAAAQVLSRCGIDMVSLANNHAWDYGRDALFETFDHLERAKVAYVGAGRTRADAYAPRVVTRDGFTVAFVATTAVWNQEFSPHPGREHIAGEDPEALVDAIKRARAIDGVDKVIVSHHGGYEYVDQPHALTMDLARTAIEAGADAFIGHHPHVVQRVVFYDDKPVFYSLGNLLMRMKSGEPWTEFGLMARLVLKKDGASEVFACPVRIFGWDPIPLANDPKRRASEGHFRAKFEKLLRDGALIEPEAGAVELGAFGDDGCAPIRPLPR